MVVGRKRSEVAASGPFSPNLGHVDPSLNSLGNVGSMSFEDVEERDGV